jgi:DNA repair protein RadC
MHHLPENDRPRERLLRMGEKVLSTSELLSITLRVGTSNESALHLAKRVLATFNGLAGVYKASPRELTDVYGIGLAKATEIKAALELGRRLAITQPEERVQITSPADAANLLMSEMMFLEQEQLRVILLDTRNCVLGTPTIYIGSLNTTVVRMGEIFRAGIKENAASLIVAHNHPSGNPSPSPEDVKITKQLIAAGELLDLEIIDHIIIGHGQFVSLKERGLGFE